MDIFCFEDIIINLFSEGIFSRKKMCSIIKNNVDFDKVKKCNISCFATCLKNLGNIITRFKLCDAYDSEEMNRILLASSAIPYIFPQEKVGRHYYYDGGCPVVGDNTLIEPIYKLNYKKIIVVYLKNKKTADLSKFSNSEIVEIIPSNDLGNPLLVGKELMDKRIKWGYEDAKKYIKW